MTTETHTSSTKIPQSSNKSHSKTTEPAIPNKANSDKAAISNEHRTPKTPVPAPMAVHPAKSDAPKKQETNAQAKPMHAAKGNDDAMSQPQQSAQPKKKL